jgi:hypothetical protein
MTNKLITLPSDDELFAAFNTGLLEGTPENKKRIIKVFEPFLAKAKAHIKHLIVVKENGLECVFNKDTGDKLLA